MKVKMTKYFQGTGIVGVFAPGQIYDFDDDLATWLLENKRAVKVEEEPIAEKAEPIAIPEPPRRKRGRK